MTTMEHLKAAVEHSTGKYASHVETVGVVETFRGDIIWKGAVEVFAVSGGLCYAWAVVGENGGAPQYVTVLGQPPIETAVDAVRAWIVSQHRK